MSEKVLTWKSALKRILPVVIAIFSIILVAVIFASVKSSSPNPEISDKDSSYLTIGGYKVSKERLYTYLRKNYGVSELANLVDEELLKDTITSLTDEDLKSYIIETLFEVEYDENYDYSTSIKGYYADPQETWDELVDTLVLYGKLSKADATDKTKVEAAVKDYFRLDCAREKYATNYYWSTIEALGEKSANGFIFTDAEIEEYYEANYGGTSTGLYIPFDSQAQALRVMREIGGINTNSKLLSDEDGWITADFDPSKPESATNVKRFLTVEEVMEAYIKMYNYMMINYHNGVNPLVSTTENPLFTTKVSTSSALAEAKEGLEIQKSISATSFTLPAEVKVLKDGVEQDTISLTWSVKNYDSSDEATHVVISDSATDGVYTATVTRPDSSTRVYLSVTLKYGEEEATEKYTLTLTSKNTAESTVEMIANDVEVQYVLDSVAGFENFVAAEGAAEAVKFHWTYEEVNKLDSTVANYLKYDSTKLSVEQEANKFYKQYTAEPIKGTNYYFLVIKFAEKADTKLIFEDDEDFEDATAEEITASNELKAAIVEKMKKDLLTDNEITRILFENRTKNGLVIYDRYLEAVYEYSYNKFFNSTIAVTNYLPFIVTDKTSKTVVATIGLGDKEVEITADQLYEVMEAKYGVLTTSNLIDDYFLLSNTEYNDIYNPFTGEIIDEEAYKKALTSEIATIRKNFEYGYFENSALESYGLIPAFGADYGWNNFKEDYFSAFSDAELIANRDFGGSVYTEASTLFTKTLYESIDEVLATIKESYEEYYSVNVMNLVIYVDEDFDASPDTNIVTGKETGFEEESNWTAEQKALAVKLGQLFVELAPQTGATTLTAQMSALVELYNKALPEVEAAAPKAYDTVYTYNYFGEFKAAGLKLKWEDQATYTNTSSIVEEFHEKLKEIYDKIDEQGLVGETISVPYFSEVAFETSYGYHMIAVTGSTAPAELPADDVAKSIIEKHLYISLTEDEQGEDHDTLATLTTDEQSFITNWYTPAITEMGGETPVAKALIAIRTAEENLSLIKFENNENLERYKTISEILAKSYEEEE